MSEHTGLSWWIDKPMPQSTVQFIRAKGPDSNNAAIARIYTYRGMEQAEADAQFIVRACNSHENLVDAVKLLLAALDEGHAEWIEKATSRGLAAIAKAEGRE